MKDGILGLDIGPRHLRAVVLHSGKRISALETIQIGADGGLRAALEELRARGVDCSVCVTAIHPGRVSLRNITMPFRDEKKIRQTIAFELEPSIPFSIEDALIDFAICDPSEPVEVLAAAAHRGDVGEMIGAVENVFPEASFIDLNGVPLAVILAAKRKDCVLIVDVGSEKSVSVLIDGGRVRHVRAFDFGGDSLTQIIAGTTGAEFPEAERKKLSGDYGASLEKMNGACRGFARNVKATIEQAGAGKYAAAGPARIMLAGGGALFGGIKQAFESCFAVPAEMLDLTELEDFEIDSALPEAWTPQMNGALALALRGAKRSAGFDFRRGQFELRKNAVKLQKDLRWAALMMMVVLAALLVDQGAGYYLDRLKLNRVKAAVNGVFMANCPEVTKIVDPVQQFRTKISEAKKLSLGPGAPFLDLLGEINTLVPQSSGMLITNLVYDGERIEIKAEAASFDTAEEIKKALAGSSRFKNISISSVTAVRQGSRVEFGLKMDVGR